MDVSSEVKQKPKRFKKNYGVSTISLATIIFWMPTAFVFIVKFYVGKNIPIWIAIISSVLCIILGIIDLEIGNMEKTTHMHFLSTISIIVSAIVVAICIVYMVTAHYVNQITDGISSSIESFNSEVDEYNSQQESAPTGNRITVKVGDGLTYGEAEVDLVKCYEYTDFDEWNAPKDGYKVVVFQLSAKTMARIICIFLLQTQRDMLIIRKSSSIIWIRIFSLIYPKAEPAPAQLLLKSRKTLRIFRWITHSTLIMVIQVFLFTVNNFLGGLYALLFCYWY